MKFSDAFSIPLHNVTEDVTPLSGTEAHRKLLFLFFFPIILSWCRYEISFFLSAFGISIRMNGMKLKIFPPSAESRDAWITDINQAKTHAKKLTTMKAKGK